MARLRNGEKATRQRQVQRVLQRHWAGLRESEVAQELGWQRRTANNYLQDLQRQGKAYREGRCWFIDN